MQCFGGRRLSDPLGGMGYYHVLLPRTRAWQRSFLRHLGLTFENRARIGGPPVAVETGCAMSEPHFRFN